MTSPVAGVVRFTVTITPFTSMDSRFMVQTLETGIVTYGNSAEEAKRLNGLANVTVVRRWKSQGREALDAAMARFGIVDYQVGDEPGMEIQGTNYQSVGNGVLLAA